VQGIVNSDPSLLGFGDVVVKDVERVQTHGGQLDLLLWVAEAAFGDNAFAASYLVGVSIAGANEYPCPSDYLEDMKAFAAELFG
jgi:hypothetical protein